MEDLAARLLIKELATALKSLAERVEQLEQAARDRQQLEWDREEAAYYDRIGEDM